jgi:hypothetical protein
VCYAVSLLLMEILRHVSILHGHHQVDLFTGKKSDIICCQFHYLDLKTGAEGGVIFELSLVVTSASHNVARTENGLRAGRPSNLERQYPLQQACQTQLVQTATSAL